MTNFPTMSRRTLFTTLPATVAALALPAAAEAEAPDAETTCARIYRLWRAQRELLNGLDTETVSQDEYDAVESRYDILGAAMLPAMAVTAEDFILKVIVLSDYGSCELPLRSD